VNPNLCCCSTCTDLLIDFIALWSRMAVECNQIDAKPEPTTVLPYNWLGLTRNHLSFKSHEPHCAVQIFKLCFSKKGRSVWLRILPRHYGWGAFHVIWSKTVFFCTFICCVVDKNTFMDLFFFSFHVKLILCFCLFFFTVIFKYLSVVL
jgi:hypothetical protein